MVMMDWDAGVGWGSWLIACTMMLAFLALIVVVVVALARGLRGGFGTGRPTAKELLDERLARGEIDVEEYTRKMDILSKGEQLPRPR
jgi:putative membrane protein